MDTCGRPFEVKMSKVCVIHAKQPMVRIHRFCVSGGDSAGLFALHRVNSRCLFYLLLRSYFLQQGLGDSNVYGLSKR